MKNLSEITEGQDIVTKEWVDEQGFMKGMTILSYGKSTWQDFIAAYTANKVVYCRASSNSNPATGSQTRLAFMAYVSNETNPTNVEFQYYRSVSSHSASQQGDQVYVYKLANNNTWTVTVREAMSKIATSGSATQSYANSTITISVPTNISDFTNDAGYTANIGTITGIQMNGVSKGTSGVIDLGTVITAHQDISGKVDKVSGKGLSTNDYTTNEKNKLRDIEAGAQANVQADWNETDTTADSYILNKPNISGGSYCIDIDKWITETATSQDYADIEDAIQTGKYLYIGQEDEQSGEIFHNPVTCSGITEDSEIICYYIEDDTVHMYTFHSDGTYYYEYHYLQRKLTAGSGIEINSSNVISATGTSYFYRKDESTYTTSSGSTTTIPVGISGFRSTDILMVDVNGLSLVQGTDYTISGTNIVLTTPITHAGAIVHFTAMRIAEVTPQDYAALKGDPGSYTAGTGIKIENGVISLNLQQAENQTF